MPTHSKAAEQDRQSVQDQEIEHREQSTVPDLRGIEVDDVVGLYLREMSQVPLLTPEQEIALAEQLEQGRRAHLQMTPDKADPDQQPDLERIVRQGQEARRQLIEANVRLVVSVAKKYVGNGLPFADLIQAGNLGLLKAVDKYDHRRGTRFSTHATWWIRQSVVRTLRQQGRIIRLPVYLSERTHKLDRTAQRLEQDLGRRPTDDELAREEALDPRSVRHLMQIAQRPLSLDARVGEDEETDLGELFADDDTPSPALDAEQHLLQEALEGSLAALTPREAHVLRLRYGLGDGREHSLKEAGKALGLSHERVRQIEQEALRLLRAQLN